MQQLKVLVASSIKTVLWNARFSRISIYGYYEPTFHAVVVFRLEQDFLFKSFSTHCDESGSLLFVAQLGHTPFEAVFDFLCTNSNLNSSRH